MEDSIKKLPKIELHAHLNGSLSDKTLLKLIELRKSTNREYSESLTRYNTFTPDGMTLDECFKKFKLAHDLVDNVEAVKLATELVIDEFSSDNVIYLELRSTPRATEHMTKEEYLQAIIDTMISCRKSHPKIMVKYLPSINISYGVPEATENFQLFSKLRKQYPDVIVGIDLSGDITKGKFSDYQKIFEDARSEGFGIALHCAEVNDHAEILQKLKFMTPADRIGHGTFIDESNSAIWNEFRTKMIPVEICLTSNVLCGSVSSYDDHHIKRLLQINHPIIICTDDFGVFRTSLTNEMKIAAKHYGLSENDLVKLTVNAIHYTFASDLEKRQLIDFIPTTEP